MMSNSPTLLQGAFGCLTPVGRALKTVRELGTLVPFCLIDLLLGETRGGLELGVVQIGVAQVSVAQVRIHKVGVAQVGTFQTNVFEIGVCQVNATQINVVEHELVLLGVGPLQVSGGQVGVEEA